MAKDAARSQHILVVDDQPSISALLRHGLLAEGYSVTVVEDGQAALEAVATCTPDLILLDLDLPIIPGDEVCRRLKRDPRTRWIPIIMVTAMNDSVHRIAAWEDGADEYLTKPFHLVEVMARCRSLLRIRQLIEERDSAEAVVFALARAVEAKSWFTHGHSERVTNLCIQLAEVVGLPNDKIEVLRKEALLHDIGKISIPDAILNKPGPLTCQEYEIIREHPVQGAHIVEPLVSVRTAVPLIRWHHERLDGQGYPDGLCGDEIPLLVRILSVCDIYDSLSSDRPYRAPIPHEVCLEMLRDNALHGGFDPELVALFTELPLEARVVGASRLPRAHVHYGD